MQVWKKIVIASSAVISVGIGVYYYIETRRIKKFNETVVTPAQAKAYLRMKLGK